MTPEQIKKRVLQIKDWEWWAERPFDAFMSSLHVGGPSRPYMKKLGLNVELPYMLFQNGCWYKSEKVFQLYVKQLKKYLQGGRLVFRASKMCEDYLDVGRRRINELMRSTEMTKQKISELYKIISQVTSFVWLTHGLEFYYRGILEKKAVKYCRGDIDKFIGDISFPIKHNAHYYFEQALRGDESLGIIQKKFGWIKVRDGFSKGFSIEELRQARKRLRSLKPQKFIKPKIPKPLSKYAKISQELVYQRTLRGDVWFELLDFCRPLLKQIARFYHIPFGQLRYYSMLDLAKGKLIKYPKRVTFISCGKNFVFLNKPLFSEKRLRQTSITGVIANRGLVQGKAKIVKIAHEIGKVKQGDILIAPTTFPSFIMGMKRASAFVTDEGGITSHAAIVSRELGTPCIIGTKIATKVFKDGDMVEVDANHGWVRKIK